MEKVLLTAFVMTVLMSINFVSFPPNGVQRDRRFPCSHMIRLDWQMCNVLRRSVRVTPDLLDAIVWPCLQINRMLSRAVALFFPKFLVRELAWIPQVAMMMNASRFNLIAVTWPRTPKRSSFLIQLDVGTRLIPCQLDNSPAEVSNEAISSGTWREAIECGESNGVSRVHVRFHLLNSLISSRSVDQVASSASVMASATRSLSLFSSHY